MPRLIGHRDRGQGGWRWSKVQDESAQPRLFSWLRRGLSLAFHQKGMFNMPSAFPRGRARLVPLLASVVVLVALLAAFIPLALGGSGSAHANGVNGPELTFDLSCSPEQTVGGAVVFKYTVTNTGDQALTKVSVIDDRLGDISVYFPGSLNPGESADVIRYYIVQESDPRPFTNSATATYDPAPAVTDSCTVDVPHMTLTKTATIIDTSTIFTFVITNDGSTFLHRYKVKDSSLGDLTDQFPLFLAPGETVVVEITVLGIEPCDNTVWAQYESLPRSLFVFARAECGEGELSFLLVRQLNPDFTPFTDAPVTFHLCSDDVVVPGCDPGSLTFLQSVPNPSGLIPLAPGTYTACVVEPPGFVVDPPACQAADVPVGGTATITFITRPDGGGGEGCTPGFWKNHLDDWGPTGYTTGDDFDTVFGVSLFNPDITLDDALNLKGGGVKKLARHGTAALLNAAHPAVDYPLSVAQVIAAVQAGDLGDIPDFNELSSSCPAD